MKEYYNYQRVKILKEEYDVPGYYFFSRGFLNFMPKLDPKINSKTGNEILESPGFELTLEEEEKLCFRKNDYSQIEKVMKDNKNEHLFVVNRPYSKGVAIFLNSQKSIEEFYKIIKN
jgi:hypothetical protein